MTVDVLMLMEITSVFVLMDLMVQNVKWHHVPSHRAYLMVPVQFPEVAMIVPVKMALEEQIVKKRHVQMHHVWMAVHVLYLAVVIAVPVC